LAPTGVHTAVTLIPFDLREAVVRRAGNRCEYCRLSQESQVATFPVDHVIPVVSDGKTTLDNLALACPRCNASKWTRVDAIDPASALLVPLFNPRTDAWADHFRWSPFDLTVVGSPYPDRAGYRIPSRSQFDPTPYRSPLAHGGRPASAPIGRDEPRGCWP
jgi:5-methylcytosine-specific restriction endonuclease McrA